MDLDAAIADLRGAGAAEGVVAVLRTLNAAQLQTVQQIARRAALGEDSVRRNLGLLIASGVVLQLRVQESWATPYRRKYRLTRPLPEVMDALIAWQRGRRDAFRDGCRTRYLARHPVP